MLKFFSPFRLSVVGLVIFLLIPRLILLTNGLDSQRIWDTNTPAAFQFLAALKDNRLGEFWRSGQKYPLLGSYSFVPVLGAYYTVEKVRGIFAAPIDFMKAYALGETNVFFWIRLQMLVLNLVTILLLYRLTKRFTGASRRAGLYVVLLAAVNFYVAFFSVMPRIHSFAFFAVTLTLYASLQLLEKKTTRNYLLAFGAAIIAGSVSQSGVPAVLLPIGAHFYDSEQSKWLLRINRRLVASGIAYAVLTAVLGYPRTVLWLVDATLQLFSMVILGGNHIIPSVTFTWVPVYYLLSTEFIAVWLGLVAIFFAIRHSIVRSAERLRFAPADWLALGHVVVFFGAFGFSNIFSGRFMLAAMPSMLFLAARLMMQLERWRCAWYPLVVCLAFQGYGIIQLSSAAAGGDTRADAASWILNNTKPTDRLATTLDPVFLGIVPTPEAVGGYAAPILGANESLVKQHNLIGDKSRFLSWFNASSTPAIKADLLSFDYLIVSVTDRNVFVTEAELHNARFKLVQSFYNTPERNAFEQSFIPWDFITPRPSIPHPLALQRFKAFGPTVEIYQRMP